MGLFSRKKREYPKVPDGDFELVLRCSICTGEQVLCAREKQTGRLLELMLVRSPAELEGFCMENNISPEEIQKVY